MTWCFLEFLNLIRINCKINFSFFLAKIKVLPILHDIIHFAELQAEGL